jgi:hypothetical protein
MQKFVFGMAFAAFGLLAGGALATTIATTRGEVNKQCGAGAAGCSKACGSTTCDYGCTKKGGLYSHD